DIGERPDRVDCASGQRNALGKRVRRLLRRHERLVATDDHVRGGVSLRFDTTARARFDQDAESGREHCRGEHRDEDAGQGSLLLADARPDQRVHQVPNALMRSTICCVVAPTMESTNAPSARKMTRSASAATAGSCVTMTMVWFSS